MVFPLVDLVRVFAALTVLVYHLIGHWEWTGFPGTGPLAWFRGGWMAVDLFFVISGFVIGLSAFSRIEAQGPGFRRDFLRARLARIVPLHYVTVAAFVLLVQPALRGQPDFAANLGAHLLFVHNLFFDYYGAINGPNWSLGTEMQFYLLVAMAAPWLRNVRWWRLALLSFAIAWAWRWGCWRLLHDGPADRPYMAQTQLPGMLDEFAIGLLLARFVRSPRGRSALARLAGAPALRYAAVAAVACGWWAVFQLHQSFDYWEQPAMAVFFRTALGGCTAALLVPLCGWPVTATHPLARIAAYLGKISYGIYLWHLPVLFLLGEHTRLAPGVALAIALPATMALAALTWHLVEQPALRRWGRAAAASRAGSAGMHPATKSAQA
jgi:peptidoglycan/LPS O-acetylase OafA/YrhL